MFLKSIFRQVPLLAGMMACTLLPLSCKQKQKTDVYMWGNGVYQARPDALLQFQNFTPKKITNLPSNLIHLEFGQYYQAGLDESGNLYVWRSQTLDANLQVSLQKDTERQQINLLAKNIKQVKFTTGYVWTLTNKNEVIQYPIVKQFGEGNIVTNVKIGKSRAVDPLKGSIQICSGIDHLIALNQKGDVYSMGNDTFGQCGTDTDKRATFPPFTEKRVTYPIKVQYIKNVKKIASGGNHCLALDQNGNLFGWGSNSNMQLSHQQQFSQMNIPLIASFKPIKISKGLDNNQIIDIKGGEQFSVIISKNRMSESYEVHTFGCNLKGQLGIGQIKHVRDITKVQALSNFIMKRKGKEEKVLINQLACGNRHCIALLNIGYIMEWGDNEYGQMGNKKRSTVYSPIILRQFSQKDILGVFAGHNSSGVILRTQQQKQTKIQSSTGKK